MPPLPDDNNPAKTEFTADDVIGNLQVSDEDRNKITRTLQNIRKERDAAIQSAVTERDKIIQSKQQLESELTELKKFKSRLDEMGFTPEEYDKLRTNLEELAKERAQEVGTIKQTYEQQLAELKRENLQLTQAQKQQQLDNEIRAAFQEAGGRKGRDEYGASFLDMVLPIARNRIKLDDNGQIIVIDKNGVQDWDDSTGKVRAKNLVDLMLELSESPVLGAAFDPKSLASGGGFQGGSGGLRNHSWEDLQKLTPAQQAELGRKLRKT